MQMASTTYTVHNQERVPRLTGNQRPYQARAVFKYGVHYDSEARPWRQIVPPFTSLFIIGFTWFPWSAVNTDIGTLFMAVLIHCRLPVINESTRSLRRSSEFTKQQE